MNEHIVLGGKYRVTKDTGVFFRAGAKVICLCINHIAFSGVVLSNIVQQHRFDNYILFRCLNRAMTRTGHDGEVIDCPAEYRHAHWWLPRGQSLDHFVPITPLEEVADWVKQVDEAAKKLTAK